MPNKIAELPNCRIFTNSKRTSRTSKNHRMAEKEIIFRNLETKHVFNESRSVSMDIKQISVAI
jgi:hypothetical protein